MSDEWGDRHVVAGVEAFGPGRLALRFGVLDAPLLDVERAPHGGPMRLGERVWEGLEVEHRGSAGLDEMRREFHCSSPSGVGVS